MSKVKLGNGLSLAAYLRGRGPATGCSCLGSDTGAVLSSMAMAGSNLFYLYNGPRCVHNQPIKAANIAYIVDNFCEPAIKVKGSADIKGWLGMMKGTVALVFFRSNGTHGGTALDLFFENKLWMNSGVADYADEMWVWVMGSGASKPKNKSHGHGKSHGHHKPAHIF